nr:restriction endonuclease subunit S [uncultured Pedobacter sp.]
MIKDHIDRVRIELFRRWKVCKLGDYIETINGFAFKSSDFLDIEESNTLPIIKIKNVANGDVNIDGVHYHLYSDNLKKYVVEKGDILISLTGNHPELETQVVGLVSKYKLDTKALLNQRVGKLFSKKPKELNDVYLYYFLKNKDTHQYLASQSSGSANQANISKSDIEKISFSKPPIQEQTAIASILSSLDDKIDLLYRQNKTLEQLAETLFRQWFVEEAEESWEETSLSEIADHSKENIHPSKNPTKLYKHYSLPAFDAGKEPIIEIGKEILSNKYKVISNSILVSKLNPRTPRIWMIYGNVNDDESICSTEFQIVKPKDQKWYGFIYCFLKSYNVTQELAGASSGTSGSHQRVNPQDIFNLTFFKPTDILVEKFSSVIDNYLIKINNNQAQIRTLTQTRDTLLPKLMSGEVRLVM